MASVTGRSSHDVDTLQNPTVDEPKRVVRDGYDRIALEYESWGDHFGVRQKYLSQVRAAVPIGERVVDLGCGTGRHATAYLAEWYRVVGVDISPVSASLARQAIPRAQFVVGSMTDLAFRPGVFGAVTAFFSLIHVPRDEQPDVLRAMVISSSSRWGQRLGELDRLDPMTGETGRLRTLAVEQAGYQPSPD
jgi:ubiquinone/menaquinone biosynthesis C-methylase UbiE